MNDYLIAYNEKIPFIECKICSKLFDDIEPHLPKHRISLKRYRIEFPKARVDIYTEVDKVRERIKRGIDYPLKYGKCMYCQKQLKKSDYTYAYLLLVENKEVFSYCWNCLIGKTGSDSGVQEKLNFAIAESEGRLKPIREIKCDFVERKKTLIKKMVDHLGFIPSFKFVNSTASFSTQATSMFNKALIKKNTFEGVNILNNYNYLLVFSHLMMNDQLSVGPNTGLKSFYDQEKSWLKLLIDSNVLKDNVLKTPRGYRCVADDGCLCNSLAELSIDNWLHKHKIKHEKESLYPKDMALNKNNKLRTDWLVNGYFIEFFGLRGDADYDLKIDIKIKLCAKYKIKLIQLYEENIVDLGIILDHLWTDKK